MTIARNSQNSLDPVNSTADLNKGLVILLEDKLNELVSLNQKNE